MNTWGTRNTTATNMGWGYFQVLGVFRLLNNTTSGEEGVTDIQGDLLEFLTYDIPQGHDYEYLIKRTSKKYDVKVDINIIRITTWLLQNFLERKRVESKAVQGRKVNFNLALFDNLKIEDIFRCGYSEWACKRSVILCSLSYTNDLWLCFHSHCNSTLTALAGSYSTGKEHFYRKVLRWAKYLEYYSRVFDHMEINSSIYHILIK